MSSTIDIVVDEPIATINPKSVTRLELVLD